MTTPNIEELIERLNQSIDENAFEDTNTALSDAATALQSQAERIAELEDRITELTSEEHSIPELRQMLDDSYAEKQKCYFALSQYQLANTNLLTERDTLRAQLADAELHTKQVERGLDKATAQLAEIEKTEPVAWINLAASSKMFRFLAPTEEDGTVVKDWQPLFTRPMPAQGVEASMIKLLDENFALRAELADMAVNTATYEHLVDLANDTATRLLKERDELRAEIAAIAATEPSMIYHGRCVIDCGDSGHHDVTMLKMIARETKLFTRPHACAGCGGQHD